MKITDRYVFFWKAYIANWSITPHGLKTVIHDQEVNVPTSEHLFMAFKADFFKDYVTLNKIINCKTPKEAKDFGREVKNYNNEEWNKVRFDMMYKALSIRFDQDEKFKDQLLNRFGNRQFVEASPFDRIWGVGLDEKDPLIEDSENWQGTNLLGKCLDKLKFERTKK